MNAEPIVITTPQQYQLNGMWWGRQNVETVIIGVHGLTSDLFSGLSYYLPLLSDRTGVVTFNNRGHGFVSSLKKVNKEKKKGYESVLGGTALEKFEDCVDDIQGVVEFVKSKGVKKIILAGHSTGCQKSVYYLYKTQNKEQIAKLVLLSPLSDYAYAKKFLNPGDFKKSLAIAQDQVKVGKGDDFMPVELTDGELLSAQRFVSLYDTQSEEELFTYAHDKKPLAYESVRIPLTVVLPEEDEYKDRDIEEIGKWFDAHTKSEKYERIIVPGAMHNFKGNEKDVTTVLKKFV
ncbi:MAG: alpha/beta fold hydrolase [Patescibacteria group bacterium]